MLERKITPTQRTYRIMMIANGFAKSIKRVQYYWKLLQPVTEHEIYEEGIQAFGDCGYFEISVSLMEEMISSQMIVRADVFNRLFEAMNKNNLFTMFPTLLHKMKQVDLKPNADMLHFFMKIYGKRHEYDQVVQIFERLRVEFPSDLQTRDYSLVISNLLEAGNDRAALRYYHDFKRSGLSPDDRLYATILPCLVRLGMQDEINNITNHIVTSDEFTMDALTPLMVSLSSGGHISELEALFKGIKATPRAYNLLLAALGKTGNMDGMLALFKKIKDTEAHYVDRFAYTTVITYLGKNGRLEDAVAMFNESKNLSPNGQDTALWNALLSAVSKANRYDLLDTYVSQMDAQLVPKDIWTNVIILNSKCERGDMGAVREYIQTITGNSYKPPAYALNILLKATAKRDVDEMLTVFEFMKRKLETLSVVIYHTVIHAVINAGRWGLAESLFREAEESCEVDAGLYNMMINCLFESKQQDRIPYYLDRMKAYGIEWDKTTLGVMLKVASHHNDLKMMQKLVADHPYVKLDHVSIICLMTASGKENQIDEMLGYFEEAKKSGHYPLASYAFVITTLSRAGKHEEAVRYCDDMLSRGLYSMKAVDFAIHSLVNLKRAHDIPRYLHLIEQHDEKPFVALCNLIIAELSKHEALVEDLMAALRLKKKFFQLTHLDYLTGVSVLLRWRATSPGTLPAVMDLLSSIEAPATTKVATMEALQNTIVKFIKHGNHTSFIQPFLESLQKAGLKPVPEAEALRTSA